MAYDFDWDSSVGAWTVGVYAAGPPAKLTLSVAAPADFQAEVVAGNKPRLQIRTTGVVLPQQARVTNYNVATFECTLEAVPATAPTVGDQVHAGGGVVEDCAQAILDLVDELGPSKASGHSDTVTDVWDDTLRLDQIRRAVLNVEGADGTRVVTSFVAAPTINGAGADVQGADNLSTAPELLYAKWISVTP